MACKICDTPRPLKAPTTIDSHSQSTTTKAAEATTPTTPTPMPPYFQVTDLQSSSEVTESWRTSTFVHTEFQRASDMICLPRDIMSSSNLQRIFKEIDMRLYDKPLHDSFEDTVLAAISYAYNLDSRTHALHAIDELNGYSLFRSIMALRSSLGWRQRYLQAALRDLVAIEDSTGMMSILSLLARGGAECQARRLMAFSTVMQRLGYASEQSPRNASQSVSSDEAEAAAAAATTTTTADGEQVTATTSEQQVSPSIRLLHEFLLSYLDDYKRKAFKMAFIEPTRLYFDCIYDQVMRDDAEVHGTNTYTCVLLAALGVCLPLTPQFDDEVKGCCNFLACKSLQPLYERLWHPDVFGRDWETLPNCSNRNLRRLFKRDYAQTRSFCVHGAQTPFAVANAIIAPFKSSKSIRAEVAPYLEVFAAFFRAPLFFERAYIAMMQNDDLAAALERVFGEMQQAERAKHAAGEAFDASMLEATKMSEWLYDTDDFIFIVPRAHRVFRILGMAKPELSPQSLTD
jgi:hypothetical protein